EDIHLVCARRFRERHIRLARHLQLARHGDVRAHGELVEIGEAFFRADHEGDAIRISIKPRLQGADAVVANVPNNIERRVARAFRPEYRAKYRWANLGGYAVEDIRRFLQNTVNGR